MKSLKNDLEKRKYSIMNFLYTFFVILSSIAVGYQLVVALLHKGEGISWMIIGATILILGFFLFCKYYLIKKKIVLSAYFLIFLLLMYALFVFITSGTSQGASYLILAIIILISSIVIDMQFSLSVFVFFSLSALGISILHTLEFLEYTPDLTLSTPASTIMFLILGFIIFIISFLGFKEISHSYGKAYEYAKELERLNENLEDEVAKKTKKIREVYRNQAEVMHKQAVLGNITQSLLHDIATPMSVVLGSIRLMKDSDIDSEELQILEDSILQMDMIVENSKSLIKREGEVVEFYIAEEVDKSISLLKKRLSRGNIKTNVDIAEDIKVKGIQTLFDRVISNILINAVEELEQTQKRNKRIDIRVEEKNGKYFLYIKDNGKGIPKEILQHIFDPEFSSKDDLHLGFGLSFVKDIVEDKFKGSVDVKTEVNKYTEFILTLPDYKSEEVER